MHALGEIFLTIAHGIVEMLGIAWERKTTPEEGRATVLALWMYAVILLFAVFVVVLIVKTEGLGN